MGLVALWVWSLTCTVGAVRLVSGCCQDAGAGDTERCSQLVPRWRGRARYSAAQHRHRREKGSGSAGLGWAGLGWAGLGWLGWAGWAGLYGSGTGSARPGLLGCHADCCTRELCTHTCMLLHTLIQTLFFAIILSGWLFCQHEILLEKVCKTVHINVSPSIATVHH